MRRVFTGAVVAGVVVIGLAGPAVANPTGPVTHPGQHNQSCGSSTAPNAPGGGNSSNSPGSPFNEAGEDSELGGIGGQHYNENSQYDVACFQQSEKG